MKQWNFKIKNLCQKALKTFQANIRLDEDVLKTSWRRLSSLSSEDVLIKTNMSVLVFKASSRRLGQDQYIRLGHTSSRRFQDVLPRCLQDFFKTSCKNVFKTSSRRLAKTSSRRLQNVFKTSSRCLQDVLKTSPRHLEDVLQRYLQDVFKMYYQVKLFLLTRLWEAFDTFLRHSFPKTVIYRGICLSNTTSDKFMVSVPNLQER